jgi:hypothetical protein
LWGRKKQLFKDKNAEVKQGKRKEREKFHTHPDKQITKQEINKKRKTNNLERASKRTYNKRDKEKKKGRKVRNVDKTYMQ